MCWCYFWYANLRIMTYMISVCTSLRTSIQKAVLLDTHPWNVHSSKSSLGPRYWELCILGISWKQNWEVEIGVWCPRIAKFAPSPSPVSKPSLSIGTSLVVHWLRLHAPNAGGPGLIPGWGTRSCMPQLGNPHAATKIPSAATKTQRSLHK